MKKRAQSPRLACLLAVALGCALFPAASNAQTKTGLSKTSGDVLGDKTLSSATGEQPQSVNNITCGEKHCCSIFDFLGVKQVGKFASGIMKTEAGQAVKQLFSPVGKILGLGPSLLSNKFANAPEGSAMKVASDIKKKEAEAELKVKAIRYLAKQDCACEPEVVKALLAASDPLSECSEMVRYEALKALYGSCKSIECACKKNGKDGKCRKCCACNEESIKVLFQRLYDRDEFGEFIECSARVRELTEAIIQTCLELHPSPPVPEKAIVKPVIEGVGPEGTTPKIDTRGPEGMDKRSGYAPPRMMEQPTEMQAMPRTVSENAGPRIVDERPRTYAPLQSANATVVKPTVQHSTPVQQLSPPPKVRFPDIDRMASAPKPVKEEFVQNDMPTPAVVERAAFRSEESKSVESESIKKVAAPAEPVANAMPATKHVEARITNVKPGEAQAEATKTTDGQMPQVMSSKHAGTYEEIRLFAGIAFRHPVEGERMDAVIKIHKLVKDLKKSNEPEVRSFLKSLADQFNARLLAKDGNGSLTERSRDVRTSISDLWADCSM